MKLKNIKIDRQKILGISYSIIFIILILLSVLLVRHFQTKPSFVAGESYYNLRISQEIEKDLFYSKDLIQEKNYYKQPYHYFLVFLLKLNISSFIIPLLLGITFAISFYLLLVKLGFAQKNGVFSIMLLGTTPAFIVLFTSLSKIGFIILLSVLIANFFFSKNFWAYPWKISGKISFIISMVLLSVLSLTSFFAFLITIFMLVMLTLFTSKNVKTVILATTPSLLIVFSMISFDNYLPAIINSFDFQNLSLRNSFSILGSNLGLGIFMILFFIIGLIILWTHFTQTRLYHLLVLIFVSISFFSPTLRAYASLIMIIYCVVALKHLYYRKWELEIIQSGTMLLIVCALIFSSLSQITLLINSELSVQSLSALKALKEYPSGVVFSQKDLLSSVQYFSEKRTLLSEQYSSDELQEYLTLLGVSRLNDAKSLIKKNEIRYFLITPEMKATFWENKEVELLFLLHHSESFKKRYDWQGYEIWEYVEPVI